MEGCGQNTKDRRTEISVWPSRPHKQDKQVSEMRQICVLYIYKGFFPIIAGLCSLGMRANGQGGVEHYSPAIIEKNPI